MLKFMIFATSWNYLESFHNPNCVKKYDKMLNLSLIAKRNWCGMKESIFKWICQWNFFFDSYSRLCLPSKFIFFSQPLSQFIWNPGCIELGESWHTPHFFFGWAGLLNVLTYLQIICITNKTNASHEHTSCFKLLQTFQLHAYNYMTEYQHI